MSFYEKYLKYKNKYLSLKNCNQTGGDPIEEAIKSFERNVIDYDNLKSRQSEKMKAGLPYADYDESLSKLDGPMIEKETFLYNEYRKIFFNWLENKNKLALNEFLRKINESKITSYYKLKILDFKKIIGEEFKDLISKKDIDNLTKFIKNLKFLLVINESVIEILDLNKILVLLNDLQTEDVRILELLLPLYPQDQKHIAPFLTLYNQITTINICLLDYILNKIYFIFPTRKIKFYEKIIEIISNPENSRRITNTLETLEYLAKIKPE